MFIVVLLFMLFDSNSCWFYLKFVREISLLTRFQKKAWLLDRGCWWVVGGWLSSRGFPIDNIFFFDKMTKFHRRVPDMKTHVQIDLVQLRQVKIENLVS